MRKSGSEIIIHILESFGVKTVAGIPGSSILPLYDSLSKSSIKHIAVRQEQAGGFLAQGISRSTGDVAVCLATSGPGAMNLLTAIADARSDSVPIIAITGQVNSKLIGTDAFQEADTFGLSFPITKHSYMVKSAQELFTVIPEAFHIAKNGRPGPVLIDVPCDVQSKVVEFDSWTDVAPNCPNSLENNFLLSKGNLGETEFTLRSGSLGAASKNVIFHTPPSEYAERTKQIAKLLSKSKKPVLLVGGGCNSIEASKEIRKFIKSYKLPVVCTLMGLGVVPSSSELFLGMIGIHGSDAANSAIHDSDLILAVGTRFDERARGIRVGQVEENVQEKFSPKAKIVHIDIDAAEINKIMQSTISIVADAQSVFPILTQLILEKKDKTEADLKNEESREKWILKNQKKRGKIATPKQQANTSSETPKPAEDTTTKTPDRKTNSAISNKVSKGEFINPFDFISSIPSLAEKHGIKKSNLIVTTDVGQHQMWAANNYPVEEPRTFLTSGSLGTMGFGLPTAIGAAIANPTKHVICFSGDGSILMNIQELVTLKEQNLPVTIFVFQNGTYGLVRQQQKILFKGNFSASEFESNADLISIAKGFGINAVNANDETWEKLAFGKSPCLVVVETNPNEDA